MKLWIKALPRARAHEILGWPEEGSPPRRSLCLRITAPPAEGKANSEVREFLAKTLKLSPSHVILEKGTSSRFKIFNIPDGTPLP